MWRYTLGIYSMTGEISDSNSNWKVNLNIISTTAMAMVYNTQHWSNLDVIQLIFKLSISSFNFGWFLKNWPNFELSVVFPIYCDGLGGNSVKKITRPPELCSTMVQQRDYSLTHLSLWAVNNKKYLSILWSLHKVLPSTGAVACSWPLQTCRSLWGQEYTTILDHCTRRVTVVV